MSSPCLTAAIPTPTPLLADVVLPLPLDQAYTYTVPNAFHLHVRAGCRVLVPFGRRQLTGVVTGVHDGQDRDELKSISDVLDEEPSFSEEMLRLTKWISDYYVCSWGEVLKAALPAGTDVETQYVIRRTQVPLQKLKADEQARRLIQYVEQHEEVTLAGLRQRFRGVPMAFLRRLERQGFIHIQEDVQEARVRIRYERRLRLMLAGDPGKDGAAFVRGSKQAAVLDVLRRFGAEGEPEPRQADVLVLAGATAATVRSLAAKGLLEVIEREVVRSPFRTAVAPAGIGTALKLHPAQEKALEKIAVALEERQYHTFLLHGITGSGKTEVYIAALKQVLEQGRTGIVLVPEIALTPQTVRRFQAHFGDRIAVLHSRMSLGERYDTWRHLRSGKFSVVIGPRSAVLAPLANVGLIVVDEEHESSYKQFDPAPRYHARDVAAVRAQMSGAVCVLGSATPSLESFVNAESGKYTLLRMPERVPVAGYRAAPLPPVRIIDLGLEKKKHQLDGTISTPLREAIRQRLERKEQVILLQNRRGYAPVIECYSCGWTPLCRDCSVTLTYHKVKRHLRCHYCGRTERLTKTCPQCGAQDLNLIGAGTQRVEEELALIFPEARLLRMDLDTTGRKDAHNRLLTKFGRGEADILIGTQMVAKGLDFARVTLVGVVNADAGLLLPDFRSDERTFQLLTQVAGRAGRADLRGEVILQTRNPKHVALRYAREHDYLGFAEAVLPERMQLGWPPFGRIAGVEFRGPAEEKVEDLARQWTDLLRENAGGMFQVLGPTVAFIGRVKRQYRYHTILKAPRHGATPELQNLLRHTRNQFGPLPKGYRMAVDVDAAGLF
jgi:primosomal protein N' (replication factor Y) (superfamily II helicase)